MGSTSLNRSEKIRPRNIRLVDEALSAEYQALGNPIPRPVRKSRKPKRLKLRPTIDPLLYLFPLVFILGLLVGQQFLEPLPRPAATTTSAKTLVLAERERTDIKFEQVGLVVSKLLQAVKAHERILSGASGFDDIPVIKPSAISPTVIKEEADLERESSESVVTVTAPKVSLRAGPGEKNSAVMAVSLGTRLLVEDQDGEWLRVLAPTGERAWVRGDLVQ